MKSLLMGTLIFFISVMIVLMSISPVASLFSKDQFFEECLEKGRTIIANNLIVECKTTDIDKLLTTRRKSQ